MHAWKAQAALRATSKVVSRIVRDAKERDTKRIEQELRETAEGSEYAEVWRLARARSERRLGPQYSQRERGTVMTRSSGGAG